jgi:hypothetical protein
MGPLEARGVAEGDREGLVSRHRQFIFYVLRGNASGEVLQGKV